MSPAIKARLRLWEVVGIDPLNSIMVIYNPSVRAYKDVYLTTGAISEHPSCDAEYIYPDKHLESTIQKKRDTSNHTRLIREE
jgi:hypothetical protein